MKITITLPDEVAEKVFRLRDRDEFVARAVEAALAGRPQERSVQGAKISKWAKLVERIEKNPEELGAYAEQLAKDSRDFRRSFRFSHDES